MASGFDYSGAATNEHRRVQRMVNQGRNSSCPAPISILENMLSLRLHLDHTDESNGALRVLPRSHKHGRLGPQEIQHWKDTRVSVTCQVNKGGVMLMRPLLLHASSAASNPSHRRVLHFEYSSSDLPVGLEWFDCLLS